MIEWRVAPYRAEFADDMRQAFVMLPSGRLLTIFVQADDVPDVEPALLEVLSAQPAADRNTLRSQFWRECTLEAIKQLAGKEGLSSAYIAGKSAEIADCAENKAAARGFL